MLIDWFGTSRDIAISFSFDSGCEAKVHPLSQLKSFMNKQHLSIISLLLLSPLGAASYAASLNVTPAASVEIPNSKGKFDFLRIDDKRRRLLAAHENDGTADYIDLQKGTLITRLKAGGTVDTAVDEGSQLYYLSVQEAERIAVVDAATLKEIKSIKMPGPTDALIYEPKNHMIYATHDNGGDVWVVDPKSAKVVATIVIPGVPEFMVYDGAADRIYLNIKTKDSVAVIDPSSNRVVAQWNTAPALQPHGLALDTAKHRVYVGGGNGKLAQIDTQTGTMTDSIDIVQKVDQIAFDPADGLVYSAGADNMSVVRTNGAKLTTLGEIATAATAKNVAVDPTTHQVWTTYTDGTNSFAKSWMPPQP